MCCELNCGKQAEWQLFDGPGYEDYTEACTEHVGDLLGDALEHRIYRIQK